MRGIPFPKYENPIAVGDRVPSGVERKRRRKEIVGDRQNLAKEVAAWISEAPGVRIVDTREYLAQTVSQPGSSKH